MPELPEVETISRGLANAVEGKTIASVEVRIAKIAVAAPGVGFAEALRRERIQAVGRRTSYAIACVKDSASAQANARRERVYEWSRLR
jgi:formamidopyrimidine-DNA glycosylase